MSLFKAREWWSTWCGNASEEFDVGSLCIANVDNQTSKLDKIIVGSLNGVIRLFIPHAGAFRPDSLMLEKQMSHPILALTVGRFVSGTENVQLAILHPKKLSVYSVSTVTSSVEYGQHFTMTPMYEHLLERNAANMVSGSFGFVKGKDFFCVQSMDGLLTFFEQETFSAKVSLPNFLLPGPLIYVPTTDSFVTVSSTRSLESYKYHSLVAGNVTKGSQKKLQPDWARCIGEHALAIKFIHFQDCTPMVMVLGERSLFCFKDTGEIRFMKKLEYNPSCFVPYSSGAGEVIRTLVGTHTNSVLIYEDVTLKWAAQLPHTPVCCEVGQFLDLSGVLVTLDDYGHLYCSYLGTDPSLFVSPSVESREANFVEMDKEMKQLQKAIRESQVSSDATIVKQRKEDITLDVAVPTTLDPISQSPDIVDDDEEEREKFPSVTVKLTVTCESLTPVEDITLTSSAAWPVFCSHPNILVPIVGDLGPSLDFDVSFYTLGGSIPSSLKATVMATYTTRGGAPRVAQCRFDLPLQLVCHGCPPVKQAAYKITLESNKEPVNLAELFPELVEDAVIPIPAIGFQFYGGSVVSVLSAKTNNRYRVQCDNFETMWLVLGELVQRLEVHFKKLKEGVQFKSGFTGPLPLSEFFELVDAHFAHRQSFDGYREVLAQRAHQFRVIQKRLLTRFKDKTPAPLAHLDVLLDGTFKQILALGEAVESAQAAILHSGNALSSGVNILNFLIRLMCQLPPAEFSVLEKCIPPQVPDTSELGWEELVQNNVSHLLRTCLAKSTKDQNVPMQPPAKLKDTTKLKKHLALVVDRLSKGGKLSMGVLSDTRLNPDMERPKHELDPVEESSEGDSADGSPAGTAKGASRSSESVNVNSRPLKKGSVEKLASHLDKRLHIQPDSAEADDLRQAVQQARQKISSSGSAEGM